MDKSHIFIIILFIIIAIAISGMTVCIVLLVKETKSTKKSNNLCKKVTGGTIEGYSSDTPDVTIFKGIPYASPPTSNLRWLRPQKVTKSDGLLECKKQKPNSMQGENSVKPGEYGSEIVPEDCLTMNIWTNNNEHFSSLFMVELGYQEATVLKFLNLKINQKFLNINFKN